MTGIIYYKLDAANYWPYSVGYDYTKNSSLVGSEIDHNFHTLEGMDIYSVAMNTNKELEITRIDGTVETIKLTPYEATCGISINDNNEIGLNLAQNGGLSCFDGSLRVQPGCGLTVAENNDDCDSFKEYLITTLGETTGNNYINGVEPINGQYYGGRTTVTECDSPCCRDDQFWDVYITSGSLSLDVCGITCGENGVSSLNVDGSTIHLDDCQLKVNYGCGLEVNDEPTESDYTNWLYNYWNENDIEANSGVPVSCYVSGTMSYDSRYYTDNTGNFAEDQFYEFFTWSPSMTVDTDECGGIVCGPEGLMVDYGCGLEINCSAEYDGFVSFMKRFFPDVDSYDETNWMSGDYFNSYSNCLNSGALKVSTGIGGGMSCIGGSLYVNLGCGLEIEELTPCCSEEEEDDDTYYSYQRFLSELWHRITKQTNTTATDYVSASDYMGGHARFGCEYFGGVECPTLSCSMCDSWMNDQFFPQYVSFIQAGRIRLTNCN